MGPRASGLRSTFCVCQAIFSGKLEMLVHAPFKILLQGQIPLCSPCTSLVPCLANVLFRGKKTRCPQTGGKKKNNEKTKFVRQVAKVDLVWT
jgi:hypothetical protein